MVANLARVSNADPSVKPSTQRGDMVAVGEHQLYVECCGEGTPAVVLEHGLGDSWGTWRKVVPAVAGFTRVIAYSRAGCRGSDPIPRQRRTSRDMVAELRVLLAAVGVPPPYVLVGHSFGGWNVRLFASEHPEEVAGLVLVSAPYDDAGNLQTFEELSPEERAERLRFHYGDKPPERANIGASAAEVRGSAPLRPIPVVVLTNVRDPDSMRPGVAARRDADQAALARIVPNARHVMVERAGHHIQRDRPEVVIDAIRSVVEAARQGVSEAR